ncbi:MAG: hypothetical protein GEV09_28065 [Pseudonocardiaceae bacterium]|nr:hypothetical protein [Pseudonocardiaceae bacterium]
MSVDTITHAALGGDIMKAMWGTYMDVNAVGVNYLTCGRAGCDWTHDLPAPFLLGDAVKLAEDHKDNCPGRVALKEGDR